MILIAPFTPQSVAKLEPRTRAICRELLGRLSDRTQCDAAMDYAQEIPTRVTAYLLGTPEHDGPRFRKWARDFLEQGAADPAITHRVLAQVDAFFAEEIAKRRAAPGHDLISHLLEAKLNGKPLSEEHIIGTTRLLFFAGIDTTWSMIGANLWHLATHEEDRNERRRRLPARVCVGCGGPSNREGDRNRRLRAEKREMVMLAYGAANRDPAMFPDVDRVIIDRAENRHATFGLGIHRCIGSNLARVEIRVAIEEWLGRFPDFVLSDGAVVEWSAGTVRGPRRIPIAIRH
ncbi:cytochrome P450 [Bradyrhizobium sp. AZCC 2230]|uniref:cytochrome P450 n=1 Tax=Bradyrhizobium sp. AZCC 2230 TaxID=3117021 RepID=UPI002FF334FD